MRFHVVTSIAPSICVSRRCLRSSRYSHARAVDHSRFTVRGEISIASAVWLHAQTGEESQRYDPSQALILPLQATQGLIEGHDLARVVDLLPASPR